MLTVRDLDCQSVNIHLDLLGFGESAQVRGQDVVIPGLAGRTAMSRVKDAYRFTLEGYVIGTGGDPDERALSWRTNTDLLMAVMDFSLMPGEVMVGPEAPARFPDSSPYLGLTGDYTLDARCVSMVRGVVRYHMAFQSWSFEMECIDSPPEWIALGSS
jgi:hypothetical protein